MKDEENPEPGSAYEVRCPTWIPDCIVVQLGEHDVCAVIRDGNVSKLSLPGMALADCAAWAAAHQKETGLDIYVDAGGTGKMVIDELVSTFGLRAKPMPKPSWSARVSSSETSSLPVTLEQLEALRDYADGIFMPCLRDCLADLINRLRRER